MKQYEGLTNNSTLASAIYMPFYAGLEESLHLRHPNFTARDSIGKDLVKWLSRKPEWKKMWDRDHLLVSGRVSWDFRRQTNNVSDWGSRVRFLPESVNMSMFSIEVTVWKNDIAIPYPTRFRPSKDSEVVQWQNKMRKLERPYLLVFVGAPRLDQQNSIREKLIDQCQASSTCKFIDCGSGGNNCDNPDMVIGCFRAQFIACSLLGIHSLGDQLLTLFWLVVFRFSFIQVLLISQYLWPLPKNHTKYSVFIPVRDVKDLKCSIEKILLGISKDKELAMREEVIRLVPRLVYADPRSRLETNMHFI